jgi:predicted dinucleotide-binding enzyme
MVVSQIEGLVRCRRAGNCSDDAEAKAIDAGPLKNARFVEPTGMLLVQLAYAQQMGQIALKLLQR